MVRMYSSSYYSVSTPQEQRSTLIKLARDSIVSGLREGAPLAVDAAQYAQPLRRTGASFVTLEIDSMLRGCVGSLNAHRPLVIDVVCNAFSAAFEDPRFEPLPETGIRDLTISISILSEATEIYAETETDLVAQLRPMVDGLVLSDGARHRATFLPAVWKSIQDPREFVQRLKRKAGLSPEHWSNHLRVFRYTTESFSE